MFSARTALVLSAVLLVVPSTASALEGVYRGNVEGMPMQIELAPSAGAKVTGTLSTDGASGRLEGTKKGSTIVGTVDMMGERARIRLELGKNGKLRVTLFEPGGGDSASGVLTKSAGKPDRAPPRAKRNERANETSVSINGHALTSKQIAQLEKTYGVRARPGRYWYDKRSGLYGVVGYAAFGFMRPGHDFGRLSRKASSGQTGIVVNGRELPQQEWMIWSQLLGAPIAPGNYWLDAKGNAGTVGNPNPTVNFYQAARARGVGGGGSGGDNFWTTRFSAGNSDSNNSRGYVSVPGYGPVGYGF